MEKVDEGISMSEFILYQTEVLIMSIEIKRVYKTVIHYFQKLKS